MGPTRSMRLPRQLDDWFTERLERHPERSPSELLVALIHGGLRLREGYMAIHRRMLEQHIVAGETELYAAYVRCLTDTFGSAYVTHLEDWLASDHRNGQAARPEMGRFEHERSEDVGRKPASDLAHEHERVPR